MKVLVGGEILGTIIFGVSGDKPVRYILTATVARQPVLNERKSLHIYHSR
jgi:hypothetical protein